MTAALECLDRIKKQIQPVLVHAGNGFIKDQQVRSRGQGHSQQYALQFTAAQLAQHTVLKTFSLCEGECFFDSCACLFTDSGPDGAA